MFFTLIFLLHGKNHSIHPQKTNNQNLLDLTVTVIKSKFDFSISKKPTQMDTLIPHDSNHTYSQKILYFKSIIYRLEFIHLTNITSTLTQHYLQ